MKIKREPTRLEKKAKRGHRGYPLATVAYYGPDATSATKAAVGIIPEEDAPASAMERFTSDTTDVRRDAAIGAKILAFIEHHKAKSVVISPRLLGCPHEEGTDYPDGETCPQCPYWANRDRFTGKELSEQ